MIEWTIPATQGEFTYSRSFSSSGSSTSYYAFSTIFSQSFDNPRGTFTNFSTTSQTTEGLTQRFSSSSESIDAGGTTTASGSGSTSSSSFSFFSASSYEGTTGDPVAGPFNDSGTGSSSASASTLEVVEDVGLPLQTSTTETYGSGYFFTTSSTDVYSLWTTTSSESSVSFVTTSATSSAYFEEYSEREATRDIVTELEELGPFGGPKATIAQANTRYAEDAEIIYFISDPPSVFSAAASALATSATRTTIYPNFSMQNLGPMNYSAPTSSTVNPSAVTSLSYDRSTIQAAAVTQVDTQVLPNTTATAGTTEATTTGTSIWLVYLDTPPLTFGGNSGAKTAASTTDVVEVRTIPTTTTFQTRNMTFESTLESHTVFTKTVTSRAAASFSSTTQSPMSNYTTGSSETYTEAGNTAVYGPPQATTVGGGQTAGTKYRTTGVVVEDSSSGWFTANGSYPNLLGANFYAFNGSGRLGLTIFPQTNASRTVESNSFTWTTTTTRASDTNDTRTTEATLSTVEIGLQGSTQLVQDIRFVSHFGGGPFAAGQIAINRASPGVYKNLVNGETSFLGGGDTVYTSGESAEVSKWLGISYMTVAPENTDRHGIYWAVPRNSMDLPPT